MEKLPTVTEIFIKQEETFTTEGADDRETIGVEDFERSLHDEDCSQETNQIEKQGEHFERMYSTNEAKSVSDVSESCVKVNGSTNDFHVITHGISNLRGKGCGSQEFDERVRFLNILISREHAYSNFSFNSKREERIFVSCAEIPSNRKYTPEQNEPDLETQFFADEGIKLEENDPLLTEPDQTGLQQSSDTFRDFDPLLRKRATLRAKREQGTELEPVEFAPCGDTCSFDPLLLIQSIKEEKNVSEFEHFCSKDSASFGNVSLTHSTTLFPRAVRNKSLEDIFNLKPCQVVMKRIGICSDLKPRDKIRKDEVRKSKIKSKIKKEIVRKSEVKKEKTTYICDHCQKTYSHKRTLSWHIVYSHLGQRFCCKFCHLLFKSQTVLCEHLLSIHKSTGKHWQCKHCKQLFFKHLSYVIHCTRMMNEDSTKFSCGPCQKSFSSKCSLRKHCRIRHGGDFVCKVCNSVFTDASNLNRHLRSVHRLTTKYKTLPCPECNVCGRTFSRPDALRNHVLREHADHAKPENPKLRKHRILLNEKHLQSGKELHKCDFCGALFTQKCHLQRHENIHKGVKFTCPLCGQKFADKSNLRKHNIARHSLKVTIKSEISDV